MPSFKKIISAFCAAAIAVTGAVMPVMAADGDEVILDVDYTAYSEDDKPEGWKLGDNTTGTFNGEDGLKIFNTITNGERDSSMTLSDQLQGNIEITYETSVGCFGDYANDLTLGVDSNTTILDWQLEKYCASGSVNGTAYSNMPENRSTRDTPWLKVTHEISFKTKTVTTTIVNAETDEEYYSGEDAFIDSSAASLGYIGLHIGRYNWFSFRNLKITVAPLSGDETARIALNDLDLTKYTDSGVSYKNDTVLEVEDAEDTYMVGGDFVVDNTISGVNLTWVSSNEDKVKIDRKKVTVDTSSSETVTLTAKANGTNESRSFTLNIMSDDEFAKVAADAISFTEVNGTTNLFVTDYDEETDVYTAVAGFTVPTSIYSAPVKWEVVEGKGAAVSNATGAVNFTMTEENTIVLRGTVNYRTGSYSKDFTVTVPAERVFYNDTFNDWTASQKFVSHVATSYTKIPGYSFSSEARNGSANDQYIQVSADKGGSTGEEGDLAIQSHENHNYAAKTLGITLTRSTAAAEFTAKDLYVNFDLMLTDSGTTPSSLYLYDGTDSIVINSTVSSAMRSGQWRNVELVINNGKYTMTIRDEKDGKILDTVKGSTNVTKITGIDAGNVNHDFAIDNLYISSGDIPVIATNGDYSITAGGEDATTIATVEDASDIVIDESGFTTTSGQVTFDVVGKEVKVTAPAGAAGGGIVKVIAKKDIPVSAEILVAVGTDDDFAKTAAENIKISGDIEETEDGYVATGDIVLPEAPLGADIRWESSEPGVINEKGQLVSLNATNVILTAFVKYGSSAETKVEFKIDLSGYKNLVDQIITKSKSETSIPYSSSYTKGVVSAEIADGVVIWNDVTFPTTTTATVNRQAYALDTVWTVEKAKEGDPEYLSAEGVISVPDTKAYDVKLKRVVNYEGLASDTQYYDVKVQFNPEDAKKAVIEALTYNDEEYEVRNDYLKVMVYDYAVKFDKAIVSGFEVPTSANANFTVETDSVFGSTIEWRSTNSTVLTVRDGGEIKFTKPSSSTSVTLIADINYESASDKVEFRVSVAGSGSSGGGAGGAGGGFFGGAGNSYYGANAGGSTRTAVTSPIIGKNEFIPVNDEMAADPNPNPSGFDDLDSVPWATTAINNLYVYGVIDGKTPGKFCPNDSVTRAEFAKILVGAFNIPTILAESATFSDVPLTHWASAYVETAYQNGIITGYDNGAFDPDAYVTRQDMAVMVKRAASFMGYSLDPVEEAIEFTDSADIAAYAQEAVSTLQQADIVNGVGEGAFEPLSTSTRAQACQMIYNVFN